MFQGLSYITDSIATVCDFHADGIYFTFVFRDGRCFEYNEECDRIEEDARCD